MLSPQIPFILDANVAVAVGEFLEIRGHRVFFVVRSLVAGTDDEIIALLGEASQAVIVTHDRDFKRIVQRVPEGSRQQFRTLGRISLTCREPQARRRIEALIESIEFEYEQAQRSSHKRLIMQISETTFMVTR